MRDKGEYSKEILEGIVEEVVYYNHENCYAVCYVQTESEYIAVVGYMPCISEGERIKVTGSRYCHAEYGQQFKAEYFEKSMPKQKDDILKYLASGIIKGVRQTTAEKIVDKFGEKALDVIATSPEKLAQISGISEKRAIEIGKSYAEQLGVRDIVMFLQRYGVSPNYAVKVYRHFKGASVEVVKSNPYILAREVYGIGFKTADRIAMNMGFANNSPLRIEAAAGYMLWEGALCGHTFLPRKQLIDSVCRLIQVDRVECDTVITSMLMSDKLMHEMLPDDMQAIFQPALHFAETQSAIRLRNIAAQSFEAEYNIVEDVIKRIEKDNNVTLADKQKEAVYASVKYGATIITGGPGTGKTTIIKAIIRVMENLGKEIALAAPTGRAAKRLEEMCGREAKTLHRLLESGFQEEEEGMTFNRNEQNPLDCDVLIVDEMSMVDILLFYSLLKAVKSGTRLIMVGDSDQLPSVGPGDVLRNIISSKAVHTVALSEIFRQAQESMIVVNAHRINSGKLPLLNQNGSDFFMVKRDSGQDILNTVVDLCKTRLPNKYGYNPITQIQVLTPTRKGIAGVAALNESLQQALNPRHKSKKEIKYKATTFREGDKVMQIKNNYEMQWNSLGDASEGIGVFNGDVGYIEKINPEEEYITVVFDDRRVVYSFSQLDELELAYAVTVHKSQGSEFEAVVMPMYPAPPMLLSRNLFYTAVTRAKKLVVLVGRESIVEKMVENASESKRYSLLKNRLGG